MPDLTTPATPVAVVPDEGYVAGVCNIGPWEIRRRRRAAIAAFLAAAAMLAILLSIDAPAWLRLVLILPLGGGMVSWLQARRRFCVAFARAGVANLGAGEGDRRPITDPAQRESDRRASAGLVRDAVLLATVPTLLAVLLPG